MDAKALSSSAEMFLLAEQRNFPPVCCPWIFKTLLTKVLFFLITLLGIKKPSRVQVIEGDGYPIAAQYSLAAVP